MKSLTLAESHLCMCLEQMRTSYSPLFIAFLWPRGFSSKTNQRYMSLILYNVMFLWEWIWLFSDLVEVMVTVWQSVKFAIKSLGCILKWNKAFNRLNTKAISYLIIWNRMNIEHPHENITCIYCTYQVTVKTLYQQSSGIFSTTFEVSIQTTKFWSLLSIY